MKKLMMSVALAALMATPAMAQEAENALDLQIAGHFKGYGVVSDQDDASTLESRDVDILRETEVHFTGEVDLDNGLTVGAHVELDIDSGDSSDVDESYAYFSGNWGRVNFGSEDGAAYLLQVAAPSADENYDGLRQYVSTINFSTIDNGFLRSLDSSTFNVTNDTIRTTLAAGLALPFVNIDGSGTATAPTLTAGDVQLVGGFSGRNFLSLDYENSIGGNADKLTYLTPVFAGFQLGVSYAPEVRDASRDLEGPDQDDEVGEYGDLYELALRYEGSFQGLSIAAGGGYAHAAAENEGALTIVEAGTVETAFVTTGVGADTVLSRTDDRQVYNLGLTLGYDAFNVGAAYLHDDQGVDGADADRETWVVGADYTYGDFRFGASYLNLDQELDFLVGTTAADRELEADRYTGGVVYTYGPGMTFRGSVSYTEFDAPRGFGGTDPEATTVLVGTQINF